MNRLELDFIERRAWPWGWIALLTLCSAWTLCQLVLLWQVNRRYLDDGLALASLQQRQSQQRQAVDALRQEAEPALKRQVEARRQASAELHYPWSEVFTAIEYPELREVAILSFRHEQSLGRSELSLEALSFSALSNVLQELNENNSGRRWYIANYQPQPQNTPSTVKAQLLQQ